MVLLGPRQVGKTTLAKRIAAARGPAADYIDLERAADRRRLDDADAYLRTQAGKLVVIDEIHRAPEIFATLRGVIDERRSQGHRYGQFLLLGSASLELMHQASESLAGRIAYLEIDPFSVSEGVAAGLPLERIWTRGGFPDSLLARDDRSSLAWRVDFVRRYLERYVPMFAPKLPAETIGRLWTMLAHAQGEMLAQSRLASSLGVSVPSVGRYVDLLVDLLLIRRLRPWSGNLGKRLVRTPRIYVRDSGVLHALLELETTHDILGHPVAAPSWEGFVIENVIAAANWDGRRILPFFYRTQDGAEIDLVLERAGKPYIAIEIKRSTAPVVAKGFRMACDDLEIARRCVVYPGGDRFPMADGVEAMPLLDLMRELRS